MERLPNTEPREYNDVEKSFEHMINFDRESKIKRLQQLGKMENWQRDEVIFKWLKEAEYCYVMGFNLSAAFFAGSTLELGMKQHAKTWISKKIKIKDFYDLINIFYKEKKINKKEKEMAHELRIIRNLYGHANIDELADMAVKNGVKIEIKSVILTKNGIKEINNEEGKIIDKPKDDDMKIVFQHFNEGQLAWKSIKIVHTLLLKLYPYEDIKSKRKINPQQ